ncbi:MAG TPA: ScpA family protein [Candidatus Nanoarchaeia archaeon]|nr:ScpA family protein [Candidatus Nanoarchaeia archaeon]
MAKENDKLNADDFVHKLIFEEDDVTWQSVIYDLARQGKIDPWDIDISVLTYEFVQTIKKLKEMNFRLSGKVILAAAVLLKMKADRIGVEHLLMLTNPEDYEQEPVDEEEYSGEKHFTKATLQGRIPLPRKRKVTIFELVDALKKAVEVDERRRERWESLRPPPTTHIQIKKVDIFGKIEEVFNKIKGIFTKFKRSIISFDEIIPSKEKRDVVWTLIPLLHLANQGRVELHQEVPFGEILIKTSEEDLNRDLSKDEFEDEGEDEIVEEKPVSEEKSLKPRASKGSRKKN